MPKSDMIKMMEDAVVKAGRGLIRDFGEIENLQVSKKGPGDFVTSADHRAEQILIKELQKVRPKYGFLIEESGEIKGEDEKYRWIADPLDGTTNFMHSIPHFCISLALEEKQPSGKREIIAAVIHAPAFNEIYRAERGQGAYLNNRRLAVSGRTRLDESLISAYLVEGNGSPKSVTNRTILLSKVSTVRVLGASALELAYVAAGKLDAFIDDRLHPWDMAAGILLVREAHGMVTEINGGSDVMENNNILAANPTIHESIRTALRKGV